MERIWDSMLAYQTFDNQECSMKIFGENNLLLTNPVNLTELLVAGLLGFCLWMIWDFKWILAPWVNDLRFEILRLHTYFHPLWFMFSGNDIYGNLIFYHFPFYTSFSPSKGKTCLDTLCGEHIKGNMVNLDVKKAIKCYQCSIINF